MRDRITWPGVVLGVYSQRNRPSATMRSPLGAVNRIAKRLGRIWYSRPRVVSGVPIIGFVMICTKSAERLVIVWYVALARSRMGQGSGDWSARESPIARSAERGTRNAEHAYQRWLGCSAFRLPRSAFSVLTPQIGRAHV